MIPLLPATVNKNLQEIRALFIKAEGAIKKVEYIDGELVIPAVNQLRYTGNHLVRFLDGLSDVSELEAAAKHCQRAAYDAYEAAIISALLEYDKFRDDYRLIVISDIVCGYAEIVTLIEAARDFLEEVKPDSRETFYQQCEAHFDQVSGKLKILRSSREELNKLIKRERRNAFFAIITFLTFCLGTLTFACSFLDKTPKP